MLQNFVRSRKSTGVYTTGHVVMIDAEKDGTKMAEASHLQVKTPPLPPPPPQSQAPVAVQQQQQQQQQDMQPPSPSSQQAKVPLNESLKPGRSNEELMQDPFMELRTDQHSLTLWPYCTVCNKTLDKHHLVSDKHCKKLHWYYTDGEGTDTPEAAQWLVANIKRQVEIELSLIHI